LVRHWVVELDRRCRRTGLDEVDDEVEHVVPEGAHLLGVRLEGDR
jgi:hypothetical protein